MYAAPTFDATKEIKELRERLKCIFDVFDVIIREYKELEMYYDLPKTYLGVANIMLDRCEEMEDADLQEEYPLKQRLVFRLNNDQLLILFLTGIFTMCFLIFVSFIDALMTHKI